jgi:hypothetical protein
VWSPFGLVFVIALALLAVVTLRSWREGSPERTASFFVASALAILLGTWLLPGANRIHHWTLVYPFPHLVIVNAALWLWRRRRGAAWRGVACRSLATVAVAAVLLGQTLALHRTQQRVFATGGRGTWSSALNDYAALLRTRSDLVVVSWDWGFHLPLAFLTAGPNEGPKLVEPVWIIQRGAKPEIPTSPEYVHLVHPPEYRWYPYGARLLKRAAGERHTLSKHADREGRTAFYTVQFQSSAPLPGR